MNYLDSLYPGRKFLREIRKATNNNGVASYVLLRGIVISINTIVAQREDSYQIPPYSLNLKIIGEDVSTDDPFEDPTNWFSPLLPINFIILPEVGEEVLAIRETNSRKSIGFWIGRVNETAFLTRYLARDWINAQEPQLKYGFPFDVKDIENNAGGTLKSENINIFLKDLLPGDVSLQGRSGTYHIHTRDVLNKKGSIETGVNIFVSEDVGTSVVSETASQSAAGVYGNSQNTEIKTSVVSRTVTREKEATKVCHYAELSLSDMFNISNIDFSSSGIDRKIQTSLLYSSADRILSYSKTGEPLIYREVLGEKINSNIVALMEEVKKISILVKESINSIAKMLSEHQHTLDNVDLKTSFSVPIPEKSMGDQSREISFNTKGKKVEKPENIQAPSLLAIDSINNKINEIIASLEDNLSKTHFIN